VAAARSTEADDPPDRVAGELARLDLLDQASQLPAVALAQIAGAAAAAPDELHDPPALVRLELLQVLAREDQQLAQDDEAGGGDTTGNASE
jgi:hypothetical protein